jgi:hypothetical protein
MIRDENGEKLIAKISEELSKCYERIDFERKTREDAQSTMFRMIEDMHQNILTEIQV